MTSLDHQSSRDEDGGMKTARLFLFRRWRGLMLGVLLSVLVGCNMDMPTMGGRQFWSDVAWSDGWRVQQHVWTGHCRLLDPEDVRREWGSESLCRANLPQGRADRLVILLHGLGRTRFSMEPLRLKLEAGGHRVASLSYPSTRASIDEHAERIERVLNRLEGVDQVSFVTHSLGGRVALRLLERRGAWMDRMEIEHLVQLAPPNGGSSLARQLAGVPLVSTLMGPSFLEVRYPAKERPPSEIAVGVIAGELGSPRGWNPLLAAGNDGVVTLAETRPDFAHEYLQLDAAHTFLMGSNKALAAVSAFLNGRALQP